MANFTAGTSFSDGVTNDVTAAKLNALVADAVPTSNLSLNSTTGTIATFNSTTGTIATLNSTTPTFLGAITASTNTINVGSGQIYKDASGNVGVGTVSPANLLHVKKASGGGTAQFEGQGASDSYVNITNTGVSNTFLGFNNSGSTNSVGIATGVSYFANANAFPLAFSTSNTERLRIDSSGNLLVGQSSGSYNIISKSLSTEVGAVILSVERQQTGISSLLCYAVSQTNYNAANSANKMGRDATTLRSLNAGGTVNSSGADYAEYMVKSGNFTVAKGDIVGINAQGQLTNVFSDAVSFCVKSTDPSYVGGDVWGNEDAIGKRPELDAPQAEKDAFEATLETARQAVDRIAFSGQVPVNVLGATAGQYVIPVNDGGAIKGELVSSPTFEQYKSAIGKVIAIEQDGRARIIVKVA